MGSFWKYDVNFFVGTIDYEGEGEDVLCEQYFISFHHTNYIASHTHVLHSESEVE